MDKINQIETLLASIEANANKLTFENDTFEQLENQFTENIEAAKLSKEFAYFFSTLYLAQQKMLNKLDSKDPILKNMKRIQEKESRIKKIESNLTEVKPKKTVTKETYEHLMNPKGDSLRKRSQPDKNDKIDM